MIRFFIYLTYFLIFFPNIFLAQINNKIVLKIENEIITNFDIKNKILSSIIISNNEINQENIDKYKKVVLNFLIENKLKKIEVEKYNIKANKAETDAYLKSISTSVFEIKKKFEANNLDFQHLIDEVETEMRWKNLILQIYSKKIQIDEIGVDKEVNQILNNEKKVESFKISKIEISFENNNDLKNLEDEIKNEILISGFDKVALKYSNADPKSSDLGWINSQSLSSEISKVLKNMKIGDVSPPIKKQNSIIFLKLNDKKNLKSSNVDVANLKKDLIDKKKNEQFNLYSKSHLSKLRNSSFIEYK